MNGITRRAWLMAACCASATYSLAQATEVTESSEITEYCIPQTSVRGGYEDLMIDHNMIIPPSDHFKRADVFIAARLKSDPNALWLLSGITWKSIESAADLPRAQYKSYAQLPLVVPVSVFNSPFDVTGMMGDVELWTGYGFRSESESTVESFNEMVAASRFEILWEAPSQLSPFPELGLRGPYSQICMETSVVKKTILTAEPTVGTGATVGSSATDN